MIIAQEYFANKQLTKPNGSVEVFSTEEIKNSLLPFPWNGPTGIDLRDMNNPDTINRIRTEKKKLVYPKGSVGQLLFLVYPHSSTPDLRTDISQYQLMAYHGPNTTMSALNDGFLCFIVNDVITLKEEPTVLNWQDNIGYFAVRMLIKLKD